MKSKRIFFITAIIMLITSACQYTIPVSSLNVIPNTNLMAVVENTNPLQSIFATYFFIPPILSNPPCENSTYVKDITIADNTVIEPGETFTKKWMIKNSGSCAWTRRYSLQFANGDKMSGNTTYLTKWVPPDHAIVISVELVAPITEGTYTGYWILTDASGTAFGNYFYVKIVV
jgi:hypothetical protein